MNDGNLWKHSIWRIIFFLSRFVLSPSSFVKWNSSLSFFSGDPSPRDLDVKSVVQEWRRSSGRKIREDEFLKMKYKTSTFCRALNLINENFIKSYLQHGDIFITYIIHYIRNARIHTCVCGCVGECRRNIFDVQSRVNIVYTIHIIRSTDTCNYCLGFETIPLERN